MGVYKIKLPVHANLSLDLDKASVEEIIEKCENRPSISKITKSVVSKDLFE